MKRRLLTIALAFVLAFSITTNVFAQAYYFSMDRLVVDVYWNSDGTGSLEYLLTFTNQPGGHPIEFVDVGMPNGNFDFNSIEASINGNPLSISRDFEGIGGNGFSVEMGRYVIPPGGTGTVRVFIGRVSGVLYKDDDDAEYVSAVFSPLYFQRNVITGNTDITVVYHLPPGVQPEEPRWHSAPSGFPSQPQTGFDSSDRITYTWTNPNANGYTRYEFGASFPKSYIPADSIVTVQLPSFTISPDAIFNLLCVGFFGFMFLGIPALSAIAGNRRKLQYLSPKISIEGHGIKRGLTAVEAAILMEQPLDKVMTMILFGVVKKGAAQVTKRDPLEIQVNEPLPEGLHEYEKDFLQAFRAGSDAKTRRKDLQEMTVKLVRSVSEKMKGFSRRESLDYYKAIMEKAWQQVEAADTPEVKSKMFEEALEWTMLDRNYDDRTRRVFTGPVIVPVWWHRYDPAWGGGTKTASAPSMPSGRGSSGLPGADFAASVVGGAQTFSQKVIGNVGDFTSRVTNVTNPLPKAPSGSTGGRMGGGGGGRSCACACACAGCACACAGGGR
jgi:hypothetical protein